MAEFHANQVASVANASTLFLFAPGANAGLCEQYAQEGYDVWHIHHPSSNIQETVADVVEKTEGKTASVAAVIYGGRAFSFSSSLPKIPAFKSLIVYQPEIEDGTALLLKDDEGHYVPTIFHLAASQEALHASLLPLCDPQNLPYALPPGAPPPVRVFTYPGLASGPPFPLLATPMALVRPGHAEHVPPLVRSAISLAYTRTLELLKRTIGPYYDLEALWEQHTFFEFGERNAPKTMATMVAEPYVNHIPTMTGGIGFQNLSRFYKYHFIPKSPPDTELICVSRTVGADRIIDEMIFKCTHTCEVDWLLPNVPPTNKLLEIPLVGVVAFRGDKLTFEHLYWDQASVLVQAGLLDRANLPVAGSEAARKVFDPYGTASNELMGRWNESEGLDIN